MSLIEGDSSRIWSLQEGGEMSAVHDRQTMLEQLAAQSPALRVGDDAQPRQIPVLKGRMGSIHLLEDREHVLVLPRRDGACEPVGYRCLIDAGARRQPHRDRIKITQCPDALLVKRLAGERRDELPKTRLVLRKLGKQPALHW